MDSVQKIKSLLQDFEFISSKDESIMVSRNGDPKLRKNLSAALVSSSLGLSSVDYARKRYLSDDVVDCDLKDDLKELYFECYKASIEHILRTKKNFMHNTEYEPTYGQFGASLILERIETTITSAHLCFQLGNSFEGYALSRVVLEQIAWAYAAAQSDSESYVQELKSTKAITVLKEFIPQVGKIYGYLSNLTHIGYDSHKQIISVSDNGSYFINFNHFDFHDFALVLLELSDVFSAVWEKSFYLHQLSLNSVSVSDLSVELMDEREFKEIIHSFSRKFDDLMKDQ